MTLPLKKEAAGLKELQEKGKISVSRIARDIPQRSLGIIQSQRERKTLPDRREGRKKAFMWGKGNKQIRESEKKQSPCGDSGTPGLAGEQSFPWKSWVCRSEGQGESFREPYTQKDELQKDLSLMGRVGRTKKTLTLKSMS